MYKVSLCSTFKSFIKYKTLNQISIRHFARNIGTNKSSINNEKISNNPNSPLSDKEEAENIQSNTSNFKNIINPNRVQRNTSRDDKTFDLNEKVNDNFYKKKHSPSSQENSEEKNDKDLKDKIKRTSDYLYGRQACEAVLKSKIRKIETVFLSNGFRTSPPYSLKSLVDIVKERGLQVKYLALHKMDKLTKGKTHRGIVMKCERKTFIDLKAYNDLKNSLRKEKGNIVCLVEGVQGNHNVAVLIRTCIYMGTDAIIFNRKDRPDMNTQLARVSGGASELFRFYSLRFIKNFLTKAREDGWVVVALDTDQVWTDDNEPENEQNSPSSSSSSSDSENEESQEHVVKNVRIDNLPNLGNEKNVIVFMTSKSESHKHSIDYLVSVPPLGDESNIDKFPYNLIKNLNTGVTAGMLLAHLRKDKGKLI